MCHLLGNDGFGSSSNRRLTGLCIGSMGVQICLDGRQPRSGRACRRCGRQPQPRAAIDMLLHIAGGQTDRKNITHGIGLQQIALEPAGARSCVTAGLRVRDQIAAGIQLVDLHIGRHGLGQQVTHMGHHAHGAPFFLTGLFFAAARRRGFIHLRLKKNHADMHRQRITLGGLVAPCHSCIC